MMLLCFIIGGLIGFYIGYVSGRAKGFGDCWNQYLKDQWDKMERDL